VENIRNGWMKMFVWEHGGYVGNGELIGLGDLKEEDLLEMT